MRVGPIGVLRRAAAVYVTVVRNTPLLMIFLFCRSPGRQGLDSAFTLVEVHIGSTSPRVLLPSASSR